MQNSCACRDEPGWLRAVVLVATLACAAPAAAAPQPPIGDWVTEGGGAVISIGRCGPALCGQIAGIPLELLNEPTPTDKAGHSQCHLTIIWDGTAEDDHWRAYILDPRSDSTYRIHMQLEAPGRLRVRGYIGIPLLGQTQVWTAYTAKLPPDCRLKHLP